MLELITQPLSVFPNLFDYAFYAPFLLRIGLGLVLFSLAYNLGFGQKNKTIEILNHFSFIKPQAFFVKLMSLIVFVIGFMLVIGLYTQIVAILAIIIGLKMLWVNIVYKTNFGLNENTCLLIIIIGLALMIAGPGAMAIDLPF